MPAWSPAWRRWLAWCVHAYTALGLVAAAGIAVLIVRGDAASFRPAGHSNATGRTRSNIQKACR